MPACICVHGLHCAHSAIGTHWLSHWNTIFKSPLDKRTPHACNRVIRPNIIVNRRKYGYPEENSAPM